MDCLTVWHMRFRMTIPYLLCYFFDEYVWFLWSPAKIYWTLYWAFLCEHYVLTTFPGENITTLRFSLSPTLSFSFLSLPLALSHSLFLSLSLSLSFSCVLPFIFLSLPLVLIWYLFLFSLCIWQPKPWYSYRSTKENNCSWEISKGSPHFMNWPNICPMTFRIETKIFATFLWPCLVLPKLWVWCPYNVSWREHHREPFSPSLPASLSACLPASFFSLPPCLHASLQASLCPFSLPLPPPASLPSFHLGFFLFVSISLYLFLSPPLSFVYTSDFVRNFSFGLKCRREILHCVFWA